MVGNRTVADASLRADWQPADLWTIGLGVSRERLLENIQALDDRITASGLFGGARAATRTTSLDVRGEWQRLSDGNVRWRTTLSVDHALGSRLRRVRVLGRAEELAYAEPSGRYFSPAHFLRLDGGLEYVQPLANVRFQGDRRAEFAVGYLAGTDNRGWIYQQPSARLTWEFAVVALDARARWVQSEPYRDRSVSIGLRIGGGAGR